MTTQNQIPGNFFAVSLGGSLIVPDDVDASFASAFRELIIRKIDAGLRFLVVTGGGATARKYQKAAAAVDALDEEDADWIGVHCTRLNAHFIRTVFKDVAHPKIFHDPSELNASIEEPLVVGAGWRPGWSTDYIAVLLGERMGVRKIVNLSNTDGVYDKDPRTSTDAVLLPEVCWPAYRALIPEVWTPGLSTPFDPVASREAEKRGFEVAVMNGDRLDNFDKYLNGEPFQGTIIR